MMEPTDEAWRWIPPTPRICFGAGALSALPQVLSPRERILIVSDAGLAAAGWIERLGRLLAAGGVDHRVFDGVSADPEIAAVEAALERARQEGCTAVIGMGGGSSLDAAKALAARLASPEVALRSYGDGLPVAGPVAPLYAVPSTAGTGSEATRVAVITDPARREKMAIRGDALLPRAAILDPEILATLPPRVAAACGADALTHAVEAYTSRNADAFSDGLALTAVALIAGHLPRLVNDRSDPAAAAAMLWASNLAGQAFAHAGLGLVHSLAEPLGSFFHVEHGLACSLFLPAVMEFNLKAAPERYARIGRALGVSAGGDSALAAGAVEAVRELLGRIGLPASYREAGIDFELDEAMLAQVAPQFSTRCNPRVAEIDELRGLFLRLAN